MMSGSRTAASQHTETIYLICQLSEQIYLHQSRNFLVQCKYIFAQSISTVIIRVSGWKNGGDRPSCCKTVIDDGRFQVGMGEKAGSVWTVGV
jgi:hypothetical protein